MITKAKIKLLKGAEGIAYVEEGSGDALVFVHGSLCDYRYWQPQIDGLSTDFRVVAPSLSHFHPRLPSSIGKPFSWTAHVDQLVLFLQKLDAPRIHLAGHSRGSAVAYQLALRNPELLSSLTLVDPAGPNERDMVGDELLPPDVQEQRQRATELIATGDTDAGLRIFVDSTSRPGFWDRSASVFQNMARDNAGTLCAQVHDPLPMFRFSEAATLRFPCLLVKGERSPEMYRANAERLAEWIPQSRVETIKGASHGMTWSHPQAFNRLLKAFLEEVAIS